MALEIHDFFAPSACAIIGGTLVKFLDWYLKKKQFSAADQETLRKALSEERERLAVRVDQLLAHLDDCRNQNDHLREEHIRLHTQISRLELNIERLSTDFNDYRRKHPDEEEPHAPANRYDTGGESPPAPLEKLSEM